MILPIVAYGDPVLKKMGEEIDRDYPGLQELIGNMFETMYNAKGVGLAAPQVGKAIRLFVVDAIPFADDEDEEMDEKEIEFLRKFKKVFINARILNEDGEDWKFNEGCLSIPKIREDVMRPPHIELAYLDEDFKEHVETFTGMAARIIQHEYDHIDGMLFTDRISPLRKRLIKGKLTDISNGKVKTDYKMRFPRK
ncbi:MAG: peptide deformylase [Bacteroidia bacterium]